MVLKRVSLIAAVIGLGFGLAVSGCGGDSDSTGGAPASVEAGVVGGTGAADLIAESEEQVAASVSRLADDAEVMVDDAVESAKKTAKEAGDAVTEAGDSAMDAVSDAGDSATAAMDDAVDSAGGAVDTATGNLEDAKNELGKGRIN